MKLLILILSILWIVPAIAEQYQAVIYCNARNPEVAEDIREHWKPEIPDVGVDEVIRDHVVLERLGLKRVYHALVETSDGSNGQIGRIKDHIREVNGCEAPTLQGPTCSTQVGLQILAWWDRDVEQMYLKLWQDRITHNVFQTIAKGTLRYKLSECPEDGPCIVSVTEAEDTHGETIVTNQILIPHRFSGK